MKNYLFTILIVLILAFAAFGQRTFTPLTYPCPNLPSARSSLQFTRTGDINVIPCPAKNLLINGLPIAGTFASLNGLTSNVQTLSVGSGDIASWSSVGSDHQLKLPITSVTSPEVKRTGSIPYFTGINSLGASVIKQTTNKLAFFTPADNFSLTIDQSTGVKLFIPEDPANPRLDILSDITTVRADELRLTSGSLVSIGDSDGSNDSMKFVVDVAGHEYRFISGNSNESLFYSSIAKFFYSRTVTPIGTLGAVTINKPAGTVNIAAAGTSVVVTNSTVDVNSIILVTTQTNDATCSVKNVVPAAGSFTIRTTAACTGSTAFGFLVTN